MPPQGVYCGEPRSTTQQRSIPLFEPGDTEEGEPDDLGDEEGVPLDLVELYEVLEWRVAVDDESESDS